jgi:hypothetical protein
MGKLQAPSTKRRSSCSGIAYTQRRWQGYPSQHPDSDQGQSDFTLDTVPQWTTHRKLNIRALSYTQADVVAVTNEFSALPVEAQNLLKTALNNQLKQSIYKQTPEEQLTAIKNSVNAAFNKVQKDMGDILTNNITDITDASDLQALKNCITTIVEMGGRTADNGNCLTNSGYALDSLRDQFNMFGEACQALHSQTLTDRFSLPLLALESRPSKASRVPTHLRTG